MMEMSIIELKSGAQGTYPNLVNNSCIDFTIKLTIT